MSNTYDRLLVPTDRVDDIVPMDNQIIVRVEFPKSALGKGIIMTDTSMQKEIAQRIIGNIIKIGPNVDFFKVGDEVIYAKYAGTVVSRKDESEPGKEDGFEIRIMEEKEIIAKLEKKGA